MPLEIDDQSIRLVGNNFRGLQFFDDLLTLRAEIYLQNDNTLNIGGDGGGGGGTGTLAAHALDGVAHVGILADAQGPQFLLLDGARPMAGHLDMGGYNIITVGTVDGVDVSAHAARHAYTGDDPINHNTLVNYDGNRHIDHTAVTFTAGSGLSGGGDLSAARSFNVGAGDGIDVDIDSVAVDVTDFIDTAYGLTENANDIRVHLDANGGLEFNSGAIRVKLPTNHGLARSSSGLALGTPTDLTTVTTSGVTTTTHAHAIDHSSAPTNAKILSSTADGYLQLVRLGLGVAPLYPLHVLATSEQARFAYDANSFLSIVVADGSTTTFSTAESGNIVLDPGGDDVLPAGSVGVDLGDYNRKWRTLYAAELYVETLVAQDVLATIGGRIIVAPTTKLIADCASGDATIDVQHNSLASGDFVMLQTAPGGTAQFEIMKITSGASGISGGYRYSVTRNQDGSGANGWVSGDAVVNLGSAAGEGFIELTSTATVHNHLGPTLAIYSRTAATNWNDVAPVVSVGNLSSFVDYGGDEFGFAVGNNLALTPTTGFKGLTADRTAGLRLFNVGLQMYDGGNLRIAADPTATGTTPLLWAGPAASDKRFIVTGAGDVWLSTLAISEQMGDMLFSQADGLALWGPHCAITPTSWTSTRGQVATISGAFHQVQGPWANSKALVVEEGTTNLCLNPSFETDTSGWTATNIPDTFERSTTWAFRGAASLHLAHTGAAARGTYYGSIDVAPSTSHTVSLYIRGTGGTVNIWLDERDAADARIGSVTSSTVTLTEGWQRVTVTRDFGATGVKLRVYTLTNTTSATDWYVDSVQIEALAVATSFTDSARVATVVNLDAHAGLVSAQDTLTFSTWVQPMYDADERWPRGSSYSYIFDIADGTTNNRIMLGYDENDDKWSVYINGAERFQSAVQTFVAGDWLHLALTLDFSNDIHNLYVNAQLDGSATTSLSAPTGLNAWRLGGAYSVGNLQAGFAFGEYAVLGRVLTAAEVAAIYAEGRALVDMGSFRRPGVYMLDGEFDLRSSQTGARVQIDADGIGGYSAATTQTFSLETDGDLFLGSDISAPATTAFSVFATAQTYNSEALGAGDVLLGDNSAGKINLLWDVSEGDVILRRGTSARITLDGSADSILIGQVAASQNNILISSGAISIRNNNVERIGVTAAGILTIKDSGGNAVITLDASAGAEITKKLTMPGVNSAIAIGETPPTAANAGTGIWIDRTGFYSLDTDDYQVKIDATDGKLVAGAGGVAFDANGIHIARGSSSFIRFEDSTFATMYSDIRALSTAGYNILHLGMYAVGSLIGQVLVTATDGDADNSSAWFTSDGLNLEKGLVVGSNPTIAAVDDAILIANGSAPGTPTGGPVFYAVSGEMWVKDTSGNATQLSPHNFGLIPGGPSEPLAWAYYGERDGMAINVDMLKLARLVERMSGEQLVCISRI